MAKVRCTICGAYLPEGTEECPVCGVSSECFEPVGMVKCTFCGAVFEEGADTCPVCSVGPEYFEPATDEDIASRLQPAARPSGKLPILLDVFRFVEENREIVRVLLSPHGDIKFLHRLYEVIREKMIIGLNEFADSDIRIFFNSKQAQDDKAAKWTEATLKRLGVCYKTLLFEAGMTDKGKDTRKIFVPILDYLVH